MEPIPDLKEYGACPRCHSQETVCYTVDCRGTWGEWGTGADWHLSCVCSDCSKEFEIIDGYP